MKLALKVLKFLYSTKSFISIKGQYYIYFKGHGIFKEQKGVVFSEIYLSEFVEIVKEHYDYILPQLKVERDSLKKTLINEISKTYKVDRVEKIVFVHYQDNLNENLSTLRNVFGYSIQTIIE